MSRKDQHSRYVFILVSTLAILVAAPRQSTAADDEYKDLVGEWSGVWPGSAYDRGAIVIHEVRADTSKARITYISEYIATGRQEHEVIADFLSDPPPTIKFAVAGKGDFTCTFRKRAKKLEVIFDGQSARGTNVANSCVMEKRKQFFSSTGELLEKNPLPAGKTAQSIKIAENDNATISMVRLTEGSGLDPHFHAEHDETIYVINGTGKLFVDGTWVELRPGSIHFNPIGKAHSAKQAGTEPLVFISAFAPGMKNEDRHFVER